jgi:hypothetical protein
MKILQILYGPNTKFIYIATSCTQFIPREECSKLRHGMMTTLPERTDFIKQNARMEIREILHKPYSTPHFSKSTRCEALHSIYPS